MELASKEGWGSQRMQNKIGVLEILCEHDRKNCAVYLYDLKEFIKFNK